MIIPIRIGRVATAALLFPGHEVPAIVTSELISVFGPLLNQKNREKIVRAIIVVMYAPRFSHTYVSKIFENHDKKYQQAELCTMLLFFFTYILYNYD